MGIEAYLKIQDKQDQRHASKLKLQEQGSLIFLLYKWKMGNEGEVQGKGIEKEKWGNRGKREKKKTLIVEGHRRLANDDCQWSHLHWVIDGGRWRSRATDDDCRRSTDCGSDDIDV